VFHVEHFVVAFVYVQQYTHDEAQSARGQGSSTPAKKLGL